MIKFVGHFGHVSITSSVKINIIVSLKFLPQAISLVRYLGRQVTVIVANREGKHKLKGCLYKLSVDGEGQTKVTFDVEASDMTLRQLNALQLKNVAVMVKEV